MSEPVPGRGGEATGAAVPPALGPHFWSVARRARWIGVLLLVLAVASAFAFLGRWQLERAITPADDTETEVPVALDSIVQPQQPVTSDDVYWRMVQLADVRLVMGDTIVLSDRTNTGSETGYWVVAHGLTADGDASLAIALGWTASEQDAQAVVDELAPPAGSSDIAVTIPGDVTGRYMPTESPTESDYRHGEHSALAPSELVNLWHDPVSPAYGGYLALRSVPDFLAGKLEAIDSPPPIPPDQVNLLNLFYAVEWVIFAGAAVFIWWRLVRDAELRELGIDPAQLRRAKRRPQSGE